MLKIRHKRSECIGCDMCVEIAPNYWHMSEDGLATLHTVVRVEGEFIYADGFEDDHDLLVEAMDECPVDIILVE